jgi:hypothetical protein
MAKYDIKENPRTGGVYCFFTHAGQEYFADLSALDTLFGFWTTECMIFKSENGKVTSWTELYCKREIPVTPDALAACVDEFIQTS